MKEDISSTVKAILQKRTKLMQELEILRYQADKVRSELNSVNSTIRILQDLGVTRGLLPSAPETVADMALELLFEAHPKPLKALEILNLIREKWEPGLARTSLSPPLSRLRHKGLVDINERYWQMTDAGLSEMKKRRGLI